LISEPHFFKDSGLGRAIFDDITINLDLVLYLNKKRLKLNVEKV